jgi:predicted nucleic acid-binding protein
MIASTAIAAGLPLFATNPGDFAGLAGLLGVVPVTRPQMPKER